MHMYILQHYSLIGDGYYALCSPTSILLVHDSIVSMYFRIYAWSDWKQLHWHELWTCSSYFHRHMYIQIQTLISKICRMEFYQWNLLHSSCTLMHLDLKLSCTINSIIARATEIIIWHMPHSLIVVRSTEQCMLIRESYRGRGPKVYDSCLVYFLWWWDGPIMWFIGPHDHQCRPRRYTAAHGVRGVVVLS